MASTRRLDLPDRLRFSLRRVEAGTNLGMAGTMPQSTPVDFYDDYLSIRTLVLVGSGGFEVGSDFVNIVTKSIPLGFE